MASKAFLPLWQAPQVLPSAMASMVSVTPPFCILNRPGWQSAHLAPRARWDACVNVTGPGDPADAKVMAGGPAAAPLARKPWHWAQALSGLCLAFFLFEEQT